MGNDETAVRRRGLPRLGHLACRKTRRRAFGWTKIGRSWQSKILSLTLKSCTDGLYYTGWINCAMAADATKLMGHTTSILQDASATSPIQVFCDTREFSSKSEAACIKDISSSVYTSSFSPCRICAVGIRACNIACPDHSRAMKTEFVISSIICLDLFQDS